MCFSLTKINKYTNKQKTLRLHLRPSLVASGTELMGGQNDLDQPHHQCLRAQVKQQRYIQSKEKYDDISINV